MPRSPSRLADAAFVLEPATANKEKSKKRERRQSGHKIREEPESRNRLTPMNQTAQSLARTRGKKVGVDTSAILHPPKAAPFSAGCNRCIGGVRRGRSPRARPI